MEAGPDDGYMYVLTFDGYMYVLTFDGSRKGTIYRIIANNATGS